MIKFKHTFHFQPLSTNTMFKTDRNRMTSKYFKCKEIMELELEGVEWPFGSNKVRVKSDVGISNPETNLYNLFKPIMWIYQDRFDEFYSTNVNSLVFNKFDVPKSEEFMTIEFEEIQPATTTNNWWRRAK